MLGMDGIIDTETYAKYKGELFGVVVSLTEGEPKSILRGISEAGFPADGLRGILALGRRYDRRTQASLLQAYLEVVNPPLIKGIGDLIGGILRWENKCSALKTRYGEELGGKIKVAVLVGMLPKEYQDLVLQNGNMLKEGEVGYESVRNYVVNLVNQKIQMVKPVPNGRGVFGRR